MKVAYWPGCVSRGFTPELHGSIAKVAPKLGIELNLYIVGESGGEEEGVMGEGSQEG